MPDADSSGVVRASFSSSDVAEVEQFVGATYAELSMQLPQDRGRFGFRHDIEAVPAFSINRLTAALTFEAQVPSNGGQIVVEHMFGGRLTFTGGGYEEARASAGGTLTSPTEKGYHLHVEGCDMQIVTLDPDQVTAYAADVSGIDPGTLAYSGLAPVSEAMNRYWQQTVAHARDDVLRDPFASGSRIIVDSTFRSLASAFLATFPNTALAAVTDPEAPGVRGDVSPAVLREVIDYLDTHSDRPVRPADITELAGMPAREIVEGLRRRHGTHPALLLWTARMRGVHRDLVDADPGQASVRGLAARWGFAHFGRFRIAYIRTFDQAPETTLQS